jgi:Flp pilus assembly protein TadG
MAGRLRRLENRIRAFPREASGATAVEFAFVALPFFALLFAIMQTSLTLFATQYLQTRTVAASREIMVGAAKDTVRNDFRKHICTDNYLFSCSKLGIEVRSATSFGSADASGIKAECALPVDPDKPNSSVESNCYKPGKGKDVMIVRVTYNWPFGIDITSPNRSMVIAATAAFLNEPFP